MGMIKAKAIVIRPELDSGGDKTMLSKEEKSWRAESDLDVLMQAKKIEADKARYQAALAKGKERMAKLKTLVSDDDADEGKT
jgi:hypothetical protein